MKYFVTGGAGFIASNLVDSLLAKGHEVVAFDNLVTGFPQFIEAAGKKPGFRFIKGDIGDPAHLTASMAGCDLVFHLAANADVRFGTDHPDKDLKQNTIGTFNVLEAMRANGIARIAFSSTSSVYGEAKVIPTPEDAPFPVQTSLYAASKLAGEGLITAYCEGFGFQGWIFRFVSVLGARYTHGHVFDFCRKLRSDPTRLEILGNGRQTKSYMDVSDCVSAILTIVEKAKDKVNIYNLGTGEACAVNDSVGWICARLGLAPRLSYTGGDRGWIGDNPVIQLDPARLRALGWAPNYGIRESVERTVDWLMANTWALESRQ